MKSLNLMMVTLLVGTVAGCAGNGTRPDGTYHSPLDNFSMEVPRGFEMRIQEGNHERGGRVSFQDSLGELTAVTYERVPPEHEAVIAEQRDDIYRDFVHMYAINDLFSLVAPNPSVIHGEFVGADEDRRYFALIRIPGGSAIMDAATQERHDAMRAVYVFYRSGYMYMVESERNTPFRLRPRSEESGAMTAEGIESAKSDLDGVVGTISFR